jgi:hypothetical protein
LCFCRIKAVFKTMWSPDEGKVNKCLSRITSVLLGQMGL